jgi:hypothetical protein
MRIGKEKRKAMIKVQNRVLWCKILDVLTSYRV